MSQEYNGKDSGSDIKVIDGKKILLDYTRFVVKNIRTFIIVAVITVITGVAYSFLEKDIYSSSVVVLPARNSSSSGLSGILSNFDIAGMSGLGGGASENNISIYPVVAESDTIISTVLGEKFGENRFKELLLKEYKITSEDPYRAHRKLIKKVKRNLSPNANVRKHTFKLSFSSTSPELSAAFANSLIKEMDYYFRYKLKNEASYQKKQLEVRLSEIGDSLRAAENQLTDFRKNNRVVSLSPVLQMELGRLQRDVEMNNAVFIELNKQYEILKITELGNTPLMNILDWATPSLYPTNTSTTKIVLGLLIVSMISTLVILKMLTAINSVGGFKKLVQNLNENSND